MSKWVRLCGLMLMIMMAGGGLAQDVTPPPHPALEDNRLTIGWIPKALDNPVFELGRDACFQAADELSAQGRLRVECVYAGPVTADAEEQALVMADLVAQGVDAVAISCVDAVACGAAIDAAIAAGVPVMTWDSDAPESGRLTYLGIDNYLAGRAAANVLIRTMGTSGRVAILTGGQGSANMEARVQGFNDVIAQYPEIQLVRTLRSDESIDQSIALVQETMANYPMLDGWFFAGVWPLFAGTGAMPLFEASVLYNDMKVVSFDTLPVSLQWVQEGLLHGLVGQRYWDWGYHSIYMLHDHIVNGATFAPFTDTGFDIVTSANADAMIAAWDSNDFLQPLPPAFPPEDRVFTMAWIPKQLNNPVFEIGRDACVRAAAELSEQHGFMVECRYLGTGAPDMAEQAAVIADAVASGVDALAVSCNSAEGCAAPINAAIAAGVPVMTWDSDASTSMRLTYLGVDNYAAGQQAGALMVQSMGESGRVVVLSGVEDAPNLQARVRGFADYVAQFPQIEIVETLYCDDDPLLGAELLEGAMAAHGGDLDGVFLAGIWPLLAGREAIPQFVAAAPGLHVVGFDTLPIQLEWMKDGLIDALVGQKYWGWGYDSMYIMFDHVINGQPYLPIMDSGFDVVTPENVDVMIGAWNSRDFSQPIPLPSALQP